MSEKRKIAVVLCNLGGPDSLEAVRPFLFNLFNDKAIINLPKGIRTALAYIIAKRRSSEAEAIYDKIGGKSPLLDYTYLQAKLLEEKLETDQSFKVFVMMRYWHPMAEEVVKQAKAFAPDEVLLVPLYPQYSTTTTASSFAVWDKWAGKLGLSVPHSKLCCFPIQKQFIASHTRLIKEVYESTETNAVRVLFSAHGLPKKIVEKGDPYQWQVEQTVDHLVQSLAIPSLDWRICYQSKVGPLEWLEPNILDEIKIAGREQVGLIVVPIAFVSEHSETLVELDMECKDYAKEVGVPVYKRVGALNGDLHFIEALAEECRRLLSTEEAISSAAGKRICPEKFTCCPKRIADKTKP